MPSTSSSSVNARRKPRQMTAPRPRSTLGIPPPNNVDLSDPRPLLQHHQHRRPSVTSVTSISSTASSIQSNMSMATKQSLSKRLRHVFSMSSLRGKPPTPEVSPSTSLRERASISASSDNGGNDSPKPSLRRRSLASLSSLFKSSSSSLVTQNQQQQQQEAPSPASSRRPSGQSILGDSIVEEESKKDEKSSKDTNNQDAADEKGRPVLRVDTSPAAIQPPRNNNNNNIKNSKKNVQKSRSSPIGSAHPASAVVAPDSPSSATRSSSPFQAIPSKLASAAGNTVASPTSRLSELPSPSPSSSSSHSVHSPAEDELLDEMQPPRFVGHHYGMPMTHGSPRLKPTASSSSSSLVTDTTGRRRLQFCPKVQVHETFAAADYDRRCDNNATCQKLTPVLAMKIKQELNEYKLTEMQVHVASRQYTHFFL
ncbi:hypothetical protein BC940DRAFT_74410 [Gongronella butleri]|nr:hypothetical protein BC940DRAFT_74410 [Gongronella butleri]